MEEESSTDVVINLAETLSEEQFDTLINAFESDTEETRELSKGGRRLQMNAFKVLLEKILSIPEHDQRIGVLCKKIDINGDGYIDQNKLTTYLLQQYREREAARNVKPLPFQEHPVFKHNVYSKQSICRILSVSLPPRFMSVSKDGVITTWTPSMEIQRGTVMDDKATMIDRNQLARLKRINLWITDVAVLSSCNVLVISTTSRELNFYDVSSNVYKCLFRLCDIPRVPLCMTSYTNTEKSHKTSFLFFGDESGNVTILHFLNPSSSLFLPNNKETSSLDNVQMILYSRLPDHTQFVAVTFLSQIHFDWIHHIMYLPHNHSIITCSTCSQNSLVIRDIEGKRKPYIFNLSKGISCFDFNLEADLLVTGSADHAVRIWDPYVPSHPIGILTHHNSPIQDILVHKEMNIIYTFSRDLMICAWDLYEHTLLQSFTVKFPFSQRQPDFGPTVLTLLSPSVLSIMCNEYIAVYTIGNITESSTNWTSLSHHKPLIAAYYESQFQQVVSGCEGGEVKLWDIATGSKVLCIKGCHGNAEMTTMALDGTGHRLITGSRSGEIKVWNNVNGECLKVMSTTGNTEVTDVVHINERAQFVAVGWNKLITSFPDYTDIYKVTSDGIWSKTPHHNDDIITMSYCPPCYLATGSFDGAITIWNIDTTNPISHFKSLTKTKTPVNLKLLRRRGSFGSTSRSQLGSSSSINSSRPASRRLSHRLQSNLMSLQHVPVDKVFFLKKRMKSRQHNKAVMVSSEAGMARFWSFPGEKEPQGSFPLTSIENENVLTLCSDPENQYLIAGDTAGFISFYNISKYCYGQGDSSPSELVVTWRAHAEEILSVDYIVHEIQPLIVSAGGDCAVRLWTLKGHYIGTFGQKGLWSLSDPKSFQHPATPWSDALPEITTSMHRVSSVTSGQSSKRSSRVNSGIHPLEQNNKSTKNIEEASSNKQTDDLTNPSMTHLNNGSSHTSSTNNVTTTSTFDKQLSEHYKDMADQRMAGKHERRQYYDVDINSTERFGLLCSPFQALQLLDVEEPVVPKTISDLLHN